MFDQITTPSLELPYCLLFSSCLWSVLEPLRQQLLWMCVCLSVCVFVCVVCVCLCVSVCLCVCVCVSICMQ